MREQRTMAAGAINMVLAVSAGAFGAHGLRHVVSPEMLSVWQVGVTYHLIHGLGLLIVALLTPKLGTRAMSLAGNLMLLGIVLFSGSLYVLALSGVKVLGAVTPLGGVAFLAAWVWVAVAACRGTPS